MSKHYIFLLLTYGNGNFDLSGRENARIEKEGRCVSPCELLR